jgi:hypothetical protein
MHTVIETADYLQDAKDAGLSGEEMAAIIEIISSDPKAGDVMVGPAARESFDLGSAARANAEAFALCTTSEATTCPSSCWRL